MEYKEIFKDAKNLIDFQPEIGIILGSGLNEFANEVVNQRRVKYSDIKGLAQSTVEGHSGEFVVGEIEGKKVIIMKGRIHYYEGYTMEEVLTPLRIMCDLGIKTLIVTNAAGGVNLGLRPGCPLSPKYIPLHFAFQIPKQLL